MDILSLYENETDRKQHENAIKAIARETDIPEDDVALLYGVILKRYKSYARITNFLSVLTFRKTRSILKQRIELHGANSSRKRPSII